MKAVSKLVVLLSLGLLAPLVASATTFEQTYLENCRKDPGVPVPVAVVTPDVGPEYVGSTLSLEFVVDQNGKPAELSVTSKTDGALASAVVEAVKQWKFKPAERNGLPVPMKVALPVKIVESFEGAVFAAN